MRNPNFQRILFVFLIMANLYGQNWIQSQIYDRQLKQATSNYNEGRYATSEAILNKLLSNESGEFEEPALLLLLKSQVALDQYQKARETSKRIFSTYPQSPFLMYVMESLGDLYVNEVNYESAYRMYHRSKSLSDSESHDITIDNKLLNLIQIRLPESLMNELLTLETDPQSRNIHLLARANAEILNGRPDDGAMTLSQIDPLSLSNTYAMFFETLLRASYEPPSPVLMVGVVLPLTGDQGKQGDAFMAGFYDGEKSNEESLQRLSILAQDSRSNNLQAILEARNLEKMNQIKALICPLDGQSALAVTSALSATDIPILLTNRQQHDLSEVNGKSFHINSTLAMAGKKAAQYAVTTLGLDSIAVIAPADQDGEIQTDAFIKEVDRLGANVVATEWYSGEPKNLRRQFKFIRKVAFDLLPKEESFDEALGMDIDSLDALFDISAEDFFDLPKPKKKKMSSSDSSKVVLSTIQGIYLPINENDLAFIGPQIPMYNLDTKVIGNENWQNISTLQKENIGPHLQGLSILTNFYISEIDPLQYDGDEMDAYYRGLNTAKLLHSMNMENQSRQSLSQAIEQFDFHLGDGFYYAPASTNKNVNAAFQVLEFDGDGFVHRGVFQGDSLRLVIPQNP